MKKYTPLNKSHLALLLFSAFFLFILSGSLMNVSGQTQTGLHVTCSPSRTNVTTGQSITWTANASGGSDSYSYTWEENGTEVTNTGRSIARTYKNPGTKQMEVTVESGDKTATAPCDDTVTVTYQELVGACSVKTEYDRDNEEYIITWTAHINDNTGPFSYTWRGTDGLWGNKKQIEETYDTPGVKTADVVIASNTESIEVTCSAELLDPTLFENDPLTGSCSVSEPYYIKQFITWSSTSAGWDGSRSHYWLRDGEQPNLPQKNIQLRYTNTGIHQETVRIISDDKSIDLSCQASLSGKPGTGNSDCFIATAAFGSTMEPELDTLRQFRDEKLLTNKVGEVAVDMYYKTSPPIATMIRENESLKQITRGLLTPVITIAELMQ